MWSRSKRIFGCLILTHLFTFLFVPFHYQVSNPPGVSRPKSIDTPHLAHTQEVNLLQKPDFPRLRKDRTSETGERKAKIQEGNRRQFSRNGPSKNPSPKSSNQHSELEVPIIHGINASAIAIAALNYYSLTDSFRPSLNVDSSVASSSEVFSSWRAFLSSSSPYNSFTPHITPIWSRGWYNLAMPQPPTPLNYYNAKGLAQHRLQPSKFLEYFTPSQCEGVLWIRTYDAGTWANQILSNSKCQDGEIILITSDMVVDVPTWDQATSELILSNPKVKAWYSTNVITEGNPKLKEQLAQTTSIYDKLIGIPLGIPIHYGFNGSPHSEHTMLTMEGIRNAAKPYRQRQTSILYDIGTINSSYDRRGKGRLEAKQILTECIDFDPDKGSSHGKRIQVMEKGGPLSSWPHYASHQFAIAPVGVGYDTYRFWEYIFFGTVPIVKSSPLDHMLLESHVPCIIVKSWEEVCNWTWEDYEKLVDKYEGWIERGGEWLNYELWVPRDLDKMDKLCDESGGCRQDK